MQCQDHPNVAAIENCKLCDKPMCGMCANFLDDGAHCEKCVDVKEAAKFVESQAQQHEQPDTNIQIEKADAEGNFSKPEKKTNSKQIQIAIITVSFAVMGFQLYRTQSDTLTAADPETRSRQIAITSFAQCLMMFRQIGDVLANGGAPVESMRCDQADAPYLIEEIDGDLRVSHPNPAVFGYSEIYVSRQNPEPTLVD